MPKRLFLASLILMTSSSLSAAELTAEDAKKLEKFERACESSKKKKAVCRCISSNVKKRVLSRDIDAARLESAIQIAAKRDPDSDEKPSYYDALADYIAGIEYHCQENPKYQSQ
jgi:hypothetical protein